MPKVIVRALALWDFAALVGKDRRGGYCLGIGIGSVRLLDVFSACLCLLIFDQAEQAQSRAQRTIGAVLYDYARRKIHRLRHWVMDPTLGLAIPYGMFDTRLASIVPQGAEHVHRFYLGVLLSWVLSHEIAHIAAGDVDETKAVVVMGMSKQHVTLTADIPLPEKELSADAQALRTLFEQYPDTLPPVFTAVTYFLGLLEIVERISTKPVFSGHSHPTPISRLNHLIESLGMALPCTPPSEIERLRAIGLDFARFSAAIADWILDAPEDFKPTVAIMDDFREDPAGADILERAAWSNNEANLKLADGDLSGALQLYMEAERQLRGADYGEGHRIVWTSLIQTTAALGRPSESLDWLREGIRVATQNYDKPVIIKLLRVCRSALGDSQRWLSDDLIEELRKLLNPLDPDLEAGLEFFKSPNDS